MSFIDFELVDIPIEFKEISQNDFNSKYYNVEEKIVIEPNKGFIGDELLPVLEEGFDVKNTVVINAGVGQGKSKGIIEMAKKYSQNEDYIVVIAVPYKNLIEQYKNDCLKFLDSNAIFNQLNIENEYKKNIFSVEDDYDGKSGFAMSIFKIHILTTNALLGNSGEDSLFQANLKTKYFDELQAYCSKRNKKIVIIFDEIHDSIDNFKEELIINLWNYQGLIHKIFTVSATYNEASKEVIKYLCELTDKNIQIIESKRIPFPEKQSNLHMYFYSGLKVERDKQLLNVLGRCLKNPKALDIMAYSKNLVKTFISKPDYYSKHKEVNHLLYPHIELINKCYADIFDDTANEKYSPSKLNIGTNFTTGTNIEKEDHNYIVIFPKEVNIEYFNNKGIFTNGCSAIIQTLARQRNKGDIHIFLPYPAKISEESLPYCKSKNDLLIKTLDKLPFSYKETVRYSNINSQYKEVTQVYNSLLNNTSKARAFIEQATQNKQRVGMNRLEFPPKELFTLYKVEKHLNRTFFGGNLSSYIVWAALCNQFLNCKLLSINSSKRLDLSSANLENEISSIFIKEFKELDNFQFTNPSSDEPTLPIQGDNPVGLGFSIANSLSHYELYEYFEDYFFKVFDLYIDNKRIDVTTTNKIKLYLLGLIRDKVANYDKKITYYHYLKSCIYYSYDLDINRVPKDFLSEEKLEVIYLFKEWFDFVELLEELKKTKKFKDREFCYLFNEMPKEFKDLFIEKNMFQNITDIRKRDRFFSSDIFPFKNTFGKIKSSSKMAQSFYTLLINVLYDGELQSTTLNKEPIRRYILKDINFENSNLINLLYKQLPEYIL